MHPVVCGGEAERRRKREIHWYFNQSVMNNNNNKLVICTFPILSCALFIYIVVKKWDPGILDPGPFSGQIRKVEARLGKLAKIRKVETD